MKLIKFSTTLILFCLLPVFSMAQENNITDKDITNAVKTELLLHTDVPSYLIDVTTSEGIVTLSGSTKNLLAKDKAEDIALAVKGVRGVVNNIELNTPTMQNQALDADVKEALRKDPATESYQITANANNGIVTLSGSVDSWQEKQLATHVVKGVKGVKDVKNNLNIEYNKDRTDYELKQEIEAKLASDVRVDHGLINVSVEEKDVTLTGTVGSASEKRQAEMDAWVIGVEAVNTDDLEVKYWAREENLKKQEFINKTDEAIEQAIHDAFLYDPRVNAFNTEITVNNGVVTLSGKVDNLKAKRAAENDARNVVGVYSVRNMIDVRPGFIPEDAELEQDVMDALARNPYVERFDITVFAENGEIILSGEVDTHFEKYEAEDVVSKVPGVVIVDNNLNVNNEAVSNRYFQYDYYGWNNVYPSIYTNFYEDPSQQSDWEIKNNVKSQLWWSPFVSQDKISVKVDDGIVTLEGDVDTFQEKAAASKNAYEGGAIDVKNRLQVRQQPDSK